MALLGLNSPSLQLLSQHQCAKKDPSPYFLLARTNTVGQQALYLVLGLCRGCFGAGSCEELPVPPAWAPALHQVGKFCCSLHRVQCRIEPFLEHHLWRITVRKTLFFLFSFRSSSLPCFL